MTYDEMKSLIGRRIEIPVHYYAWARGARCGTVIDRLRGKPGVSPALVVLLDHPQATKPIKVWSIDVEYVKVLD